MGALMDTRSNAYSATSNQPTASKEMNHMSLKMKRSTGSSRRDVLRAGAAALGVASMPSTLDAKERETPNERLAIGVIGLGGRGFSLVNELLRQPAAQIVMLCDVDKLHYRDLPWGKGTALGRDAARAHVEKRDPGTKGLAVTSDYREVCANENIDAVVIATPDHWHAHCTLEATRNGKAVYCEKPLTHTFAEGQAVCREVEKHGTVFQTGSQQRSTEGFRRAVELIRNGHIGDLQKIEVGLNPGYEKPQGDTTVATPPTGLDYERWCGPAPKLPYMRARHHRWWRGHRAFGGGVLMDWIGHHNDIAHWAMGVDHSGPVQIEAVDWKYPESPIYNTPYQYNIRCRYENGVETSIASHGRNGILFHGERGRIFVNRGSLEASDKRILAKDFDVGDAKVYRSENHMRNFLDCIKSRKTCICPAETAHRSITPGHLGYVSQAVGRPLKWDPANETILGDEEASKLLAKNKYRDPYTNTTG